MSTGNDPERHVLSVIRMWRFTTIYICGAITLVIALLVIDLVNGPIPTVCP